MNSLTTRLRLVLACVASACLLLPVTTSAFASADASPTLAAHDEGALRGQAGRTIAAWTGPAGSDASSAGSEAAPSGATGSTARLAQATSQYCDGGLVRPTALADRVVVHAQVDGASSVRLERRHDEGSWRSVGSRSGSMVEFDDLGANPQTYWQYRVTGLDANGTTTTQCEVYGVVTQFTEDGWGSADFAVAAAGPLQQQLEWAGNVVDAVPGSWLTPAYSPDGRLLAATRIDPATGAGVLEVRLARTRAVRFSVDLGPDTSVADPAFSPDGQTLAFSGYDTATGAPLGIGFVAVGGSHVPQLLDTDVPVVEPAWLPGGQTLVVTAFDAAGGLSTVCRTCTHPTPLSGTTGGYTPEVGPDGTVYFTSDDGTTSRLRQRATSGTVSTIRSSTSLVFHQPRLAPDGRLYVGRADRSNASTWNEILRVAPTGASADEAFQTGSTADQAFGYDVRQPKSKGTSDYVGDANPEILAKDSAGRLWAYYGSTTKTIAGRVSMGGGWNMFNQVLAAGDLDSDNRADVVGRKPDGTLWLYHGLGNAKVAPARQIGSGWSSYVIVAPGDFNGDGTADLLGRDSSYRLWLYPGKGNGSFGARSLVTSGWSGFSAIIGFGDFNFDGRADILGRERSTGYLYLYPGTGTGTITGRTRLGAGWNTLNAFAAPEFRNGYPGLFGRRADGTMRYYPVTGDGSITSWQSAGAGWNGFQITG